METSFTASLNTARTQYAIGRLSAASPWRAADRPLGEADKALATRALSREAEEYGADGLVEIAFSVEACKGGECESVKLHRLVATGLAVRLALAA